MNRVESPRRYVPRLIAALVALVHLASTSQGQEGKALPPAVRERLKTGAAALAKLRVEFTETKAGMVPRSYGGPTTYLVYYEGERFYQKRTDLERRLDNSLAPWIHEDAFDGKIYYFGDPDRGPGLNPATLAKFLAEDQTDPERQARLFQSPYLDAAGFYVPASVAELADFALDSLVLHDMAQGLVQAVDETPGGYRVTVEVPDPELTAAAAVDAARHEKLLKSGKSSPEHIAKELETLKQMQQQTPRRMVTFVLDRAFDFAVTEREEWTADRRRIAHVTTQDWKRYDDVWLPGRAVVRYYTNPHGLTVFSEQPRLTMTLDLKQVRPADADPVRFTLDYKQPGSLIIDRTTDEARSRADHQVSYVVAADGSQLRAAGEAALRELDRQGRFGFWIVLNIVVIAAILLAMLVRYLLRLRMP